MGGMCKVLAFHFGLNAMLAQWPTAKATLRYVEAALHLYLAIRTIVGEWTSNGLLDDESLASKGGLLFPIVALQIANPKT
ncbi:lysine exporter protein LysE/YggA [Ahrensia sp. R2A130]|nr:lysine exporter protein LysE/YggA [Ahrensia sp. R2A130]